MRINRKCEKDFENIGSGENIVLKISNVINLCKKNVGLSEHFIIN